MTKQIIETIVYVGFFLFGLYIAYWAGDNAGFQRGLKRGKALGRAIERIEK